jgi:hypothetical protein
VINDATVSDDGFYRYDLTRRWGEGPTVLWVMLNPSIADASIDDPTINRCLSFSRRAGAGALVVVNLFAFRATDPAQLLVERDPVGPENWPTIQHHLAGEPVLVIAAWGAHEMARRSVIRLKLMDAGPMVCLGRTKGGHPRHPGRIAAATPFVTWQ